MELIDYVRVLIRGWLWIVALICLGLGAGLLWLYTSPKMYEATAELFVGNGVSTDEGTAGVVAHSAAQFTLDRMFSYAALVDSPGVTEEVIEDLQLDVTPAELAGSVSAAVPPRTVLLRVTAADGEPRRAAAIASLTASRLAETIEELERPVGGGRSLIAVAVTRPAATPTVPASPNANVAVGLGLIVGTGLGLLAASLREQARRRPAASRRREAVAEPSSEPEPPLGPRERQRSPEERTTPMHSLRR